jgi:peptidoglycan/xylan/chitin deacetylase (PgdA/CDA1 family)
MSLARYLGRDSLAIFLFHGVVEDNPHPIRNYTRKHLARDFFIQCMDELKQAGTPLSMDDVMDHCVEKEAFPPNAYAITFDDGFENNYTVAAPVLSDFGIPATFYLTTGFVDGNAMSWIDRIEYCLEEGGLVSPVLPWNDRPSPIRSIGDAIAVLQEIRTQVKQSPDMDVEGLIQSLFDQCGVAPIWASDDPLDKKMSWDQVKALHDDADFIVGGHTHTHAIMSFLSPDELGSEIDMSIALLREKAGIISKHYSYPEGLAHCYSDEVVRQLKLRGIECCPTAIGGTNTIESDLFHLRRVMVD